MARIFFQHLPPAEEVLDKLRKLGLTVSEKQSQFLHDHEGHQGVTLEPPVRVFCRTCNKCEDQ